MRCSTSPVLVLLVLTAISMVPPCSAAGLRTNMNPIRKVVTLLQSMQKKVTEEGEKEKELYEKFMCYCKDGSSDLSSSISAAEDKVPSVSSNIEGGEAKLAQTKEDLKQAQTDRQAAKDAMKQAKAIRENEASSYAAYKADADANIAAIAKAIAALEKGMYGAFLQTESAQTLRHLVQNESQEVLSENDRQEIVAFLSGSEGSGYAPQSGEITGILKQMGDTMSKELADATTEEEGSIQSFESLMHAKTKEVAALTAAVETKTQDAGNLGIEIVQLKEDLDDTQNALAADKEFLEGLEKGCKTKTAEWEERSKTRSEELVALADTIKVLNDDDALDLFKKTLPGSGASLVQMTVSQSAVRNLAMSHIRRAVRGANSNDKVGLEFLALSLTGKRALSEGGFEKVVTMIDDMVSLLKKEQLDDENKKETCSMQFDLSDDKKKALERTISQEQNSIASAKDAIATLAEEIAELEAGIKALDKSVAEATEQRKEENAEFKDLMSSNTAATEVLGWAKNRLNKFYNPKLYKAPPKRELTREERIFVNNGGTPPPTPPPGGIADTGIMAFVQVAKDAPAPPPETWDAFAKKSGEATGAIAMVDLLVKDLAKEMTEAETQEKDNQADYESMMKEAAAKRSADSQSLREKTGTKADVQADLEDHKEHLGSAGKEHMATMKYIQSLHSECDWLLQYFDVRKEARTGEVESLGRAKAVLSGADYSLIETKVHHFLGRSA